MTLGSWRDLAIVLLAVEAFFLSLIPGVILYLTIRGVVWLSRTLRRVAPTIQGYFRKAATVAEQASQRAVTPMIAASAALAQLRGWRSALNNPLRREV
ncbi:MAG: hypothetical protein ACUVR4_11835 [Anaerolineae bacterium]